jgi:ABC-type transporter MlaC component
VKTLILALFFTLTIISQAHAQSTLTPQEMCAELGKKLVSDIRVQFVSEYHYNRKLDKCILKVMYFEKMDAVILANVFESKVIGHYYSEDFMSKPVICSVGSKECYSWDEFKILVKPYMEE